MSWQPTAATSDLGEAMSISIAMVALTAGGISMPPAKHGWQNACSRMIDQQDRERCLVNANTPYETYSRQSGAEGESK